MPKFAPSDLLDSDNSQRLRLIVFYKMKRDLMGSFKDLLASEKREFNGFLNKYIHSLPEEDWQTVITNEFNEIVLKEIFNDNFDADKYFCPEVNTEIQYLDHVKEESSSTSTSVGGEVERLEE